MRITLRIGIASAVVAVSAGMPWALHRHAQLELRASRDALAQQASRLSLLVQENQHLADLVANASPPVTEEQLRELLRLRNEKRWLAEQTNRLERLLEEENQQNTRLAFGTSVSSQLSPD